MFLFFDCKSIGNSNVCGRAIPMDTAIREYKNALGHLACMRVEQVTYCCCHCHGNRTPETDT